MQKEFSERQNDRQEIDLLRWDACERSKMTAEEALPQGLGGLHFYNPRKVRGEDHLLSHSSSRLQAYITSSFVSGKRISDPTRSNQDCYGAYSNSQKGGNRC